MIRTILTASLLLLASGQVNAALFSRLGGLAYYDDVANLTWLQDANAGAGSAFDDASFTTDGKMHWANANAWAASLIVNGVTGWRLANTLQPDASCDNQGSDVSSGINCSGSEMGNLFYNVLGGTSNSPITTTHNTNYDLFSNIQSAVYWSATVYTPSSGGVWGFDMDNGGQYNFDPVVHNKYAWAVHSGDVAAVPEPSIIALMFTGLFGLGLARKRIRG